MKVITIRQPWATLIKEGYKKYEFRTWMTKYRGDILIHAAKSVDKEAMEQFKHLNLEYPKGKIIAKTSITDCIKVDNKLKKELKKENYLVYKNICDTNSWDGYAFKLGEVFKINPISINGKLSLWDYDYEEVNL